MLSCPSSPHLSHALGKPLCLPTLLPHLTQILTLHPWHDAISHTQCTCPSSVTQPRGRSCGLAADIPWRKCLCKASLAWDENCSKSRVKSALHMLWSLVVTSEKAALCFWGTPSRYLCKEDLAGLTHTEIELREVWLSQPGSLMQLQTVMRCEIQPWRGS